MSCSAACHLLTFNFMRAQRIKHFFLPQFLIKFYLVYIILFLDLPKICEVGGTMMLKKPTSGCSEKELLFT